jgi:hypothetical protein
MVYNPTKEKIEKTISVPLYYTGLTTVAKVKEKDSGGKEFQLSRNFEIFTASEPGARKVIRGTLLNSNRNANEGIVPNEIHRRCLSDTSKVYCELFRLSWRACYGNFKRLQHPFE